MAPIYQDMVYGPNFVVHLVFEEGLHYPKGPDTVLLRNEALSAIIDMVF